MRNYKNKQADEWYYAIADAPEKLPFSFAYNSEKYTGFSKEVFQLLRKEKTEETCKETICYVFLFKNELTVT